MNGVQQKNHSTQGVDVEVKVDLQQNQDSLKVRVPAIVLLTEESQKSRIPLPIIFQAQGYAWGGEYGLKNPNDLIVLDDYKYADLFNLKVGGVIRDTAQTVLSIASNLGPALVNTASHAVAGVAGSATLLVTQDIDKAVNVVNKMTTHLEGVIPMPQSVSESVAGIIKPISAGIDKHLTPGTAGYMGQAIGDLLTLTGFTAVAKSVVNANTLTTSTKNAAKAMNAGKAWTLTNVHISQNIAGQAIHTMNGMKAWTAQFFKPVTVERLRHLEAIAAKKLAAKELAAKEITSTPVASIIAPKKPLNPANMVGSCVSAMGLMTGIEIGQNRSLLSKSGLAFSCFVGGGINVVSMNKATGINKLFKLEETHLFGPKVASLGLWYGYFNLRDSFLNDEVLWGQNAGLTAAMLAMRSRAAIPAPTPLATLVKTDPILLSGKVGIDYFALGAGAMVTKLVAESRVLGETKDRVDMQGFDMTAHYLPYQPYPYAINNKIIATPNAHK